MTTPLIILVCLVLSQPVDAIVSVGSFLGAVRFVHSCQNGSEWLCMVAPLTISLQRRQRQGAGGRRQAVSKQRLSMNEAR